MAKYKFYNYEDKNTGSKVVICISSYAGKPVKGRAKCSPNDEFNLEAGKALAKARCDYAIAQKREKRALKKASEAYAAAIEASFNLDDMKIYYKDAMLARQDAEKHVDDLLKDI